MLFSTEVVAAVGLIPIHPVSVEITVGRIPRWWSYCDGWMASNIPLTTT
jgi:hypothetical protein